MPSHVLIALPSTPLGSGKFGGPRMSLPSGPLLFLCAAHSSGGRTMPEYIPVMIGDLLAKKLALEAHCHECGRYVLLKPGGLSLPPNLPVPALENRFKCTRCGSRKTSARPHYNSGSKLTGFGNPTTIAAEKASCREKDIPSKRDASTDANATNLESCFSRPNLVPSIWRNHLLHRRLGEPNLCSHLSDRKSVCA
jgi:ribosomal protein L44E